MVVLLFGAPGSGKSTYGSRLAERLGVPWISSGQVLREAAASDAGIARLIEAGELAPDDEVERVILGRLAALPEGFVLDGFPRTVPQAAALLRFLRQRSQSIDLVIHLLIEDGVALQRLRERGRQDDDDEVVRERMRVYRMQTEPVLRFLAGAGVRVFEVDNSGAPEETWSQLQAALDQHITA